MSSHSLFTSLDEIPFDELFEASLPKMDAGTYKWFVPGLETEDKRLQIQNFVENILSQENTFNSKVTIDDRVVVAIFGIRRGDDVYANLSLVRPDINGSRSFIYREDIRADRSNFLKEHGIKNFYGYMEPDSALKSALDLRNSVKPADYSLLGTPHSPNQMIYTHWKADTNQS
jgi:hypothetical protein